MTNKDRLKQFFEEEFNIKLRNDTDLDINVDCCDVECEYKSCDGCPLDGDGFYDFLDKVYKPNIKKKENYTSPEPILNRTIPQTPPTTSLTEPTIKEKPKEDETVVFSMKEISW